MTLTFGRMTLLVEDCDEALEYYTTAFPFDVLADVVLEDGVRALHVGDPEQDPVGLWLLEAQSETERALIGNQTGHQPAFVVYTDDLAETHEELAARGVAFTSQLDSDATSTFVHFEDLYGNRGVLVEREDPDD